MKSNVKINDNVYLNRIVIYRKGKLIMLTRGN
jgi:hypothetical protein